MKILIDLRMCHYNQERGVPKYSMNLAKELVALKQFECYFLINKHEPEIKSLANLCPECNVLYFEEIYRYQPDFDAFLIFSLFQERRCDEIEKYAVPPAIAIRRPLLFCIHYDLIPLVYPDVYLSNSVSKINYYSTVKIMKHMDFLFSISEYSTQDAIRLGGVSPDRIATIPPAFDAEIWRVDQPIGKKSELVYIGGDDFRKNINGLVEGFASYKQSGGLLRLVVVCNILDHSVQTYQGKAEALGCRADDIEFTGVLSATKLTQRVAAAKAAVFPSFYEGLGMPILEAYAVGTPVIGSSTTSIGALLAPGCSFDPHSTADIAEAIRRIDSDGDLRARSLDFGRSLLPSCGWDKGARFIASKMRELHERRSKPATASVPLALIGCLAPENSGIATYNTKAFASVASKSVFFSEMKNYELAREKRRLLQAGSPSMALADIETFPGAAATGLIETSVFIIGNSFHNMPALDAAIKTRNYRCNRIIYLHEARITNAIYAYLGENDEEFGERLAEHYPEVLHQTGLWRKQNNQIYGVRLLSSMTGINRFIVNSRRAAEIVKEDMDRRAHRTESIFLPIIERRELPLKKNDKQIEIAHFGMIDTPKRPDVVIEAAKILSQHLPISLTFAGFGCNVALGEVSLPGFVRVVSNPSDDELLALMRRVDVAVQPREPDHGETSGVLMQLLALGKRTVTTAGTSADDLRQWVKLVPRGSDASVWARAIETSLSEPEMVKDLSHLTTAAFATRLGEAIRSLYARHPADTEAQRRHFLADPARPISLVDPISQPCTSSQFGEAVYGHWCRMLRQAPQKHRKQWEYCYILQVLAQAGMLAPGRRAVGFGVGTEPLTAVFAALGVEVLATDMDQNAAKEIGWIASNEHASNLEALNQQGLCDPAVFQSLVSFRTADMNDITGLVEDYDFTWSACCLEHLGSIKHGLDFIENSIDLLRPGGVAAHTTEFNCSSNEETLEHVNCVLFRRKDFEALGRSLVEKGHHVSMSFDTGREELDAHVDMPPYTHDPHIKLMLEGYISTSFGIVVRKGSGVRT